MKRKLGIGLILIGIVLILCSLFLLFSNQQEQDQAAQASDEVIVELVAEIQAQQKAQVDLFVTESAAGQIMKTAQIDGCEYIGFVSIPSLELELPVAADWSYPQLKVSPCRYTGNTFDDNLVIMAHNYARHFGGLKKLSIGDSVMFTDMDGQTIYYEVAAVDVLEPEGVEAMISGEYDLTLFTCTYGGSSRITIRCDRTLAS